MRPPQATRVPLVASALLALLRPVEGVTIIDGPTATVPKKDCIAVGVGDEAFIVTEDLLPGLKTAYAETIAVVCSMWSWSGSAGMEKRRTRCGEMLALIDARLRDDPHLGGACDRVYLGQDQSWQQHLIERGAAVSVGFTINARTNI